MNTTAVERAGGARFSPPPSSDGTVAGAQGGIQRGSSPVSCGYMRKAEAARYLGVSVRQLTEMMKRNVIPYAKVSHRVCLFRREDLDRAIARFRVEVHGE